jgi:hypothetical protein
MQSSRIVRVARKDGTTMKLKIGVLLGVGVVGLLVANVETSEAGTNPCLTQAADATITVGNASAQSVSANTSYANTACRGYVVDVKASGLPSGSQLTVDGASATMPTSQAQCEIANEHVEFYRKAAGASDFTVAGGGFRRGVWTGGTGLFANTCTMSAMSGFQNRTMTGVNGDTWRVVVRAVDDATPANAKVTGSPSYQLQ